jgi:AraC-like DNA-binding protein
MPFQLIDIILLLAAAQGFFLSILIFHRHRKLYANRFLGTLILGYSLILLHLFLDEIGFSLYHPILIFAALGLTFLIAPLQYLYAKYLIQNRHLFNSPDRVHFVPLFIYYISGLFVVRFKYPQMVQIVQSDHSVRIHPFFLCFNWFIILYASIYIFLILRLVSYYGRYIKEVFSSIEKIRLYWLRNITWMLAAALTVFMIENILYLMGIDFSAQFTLSSTLIALYIYALGYLGLLKSEVFSDPRIESTLRQMDELYPPGGHSMSAKYEKSGLTKEKAKQIEETLLCLMESEKPYLNSNLTLNQLADMLSATPHNLSEVINTRFHQNFFDFINQYRIDTVKSDLKNPEKCGLKMLAIAFDAGFNSKTAFNTIFKKVTGKTPSEYRQDHSDS